MEKSGSLRFTQRLMSVAMVLLGSIGCNRTPASSLAPAETHANPNVAKTTSLEVIVEPASGIAILIDGEKVAESSPFSSTGVPAGAHSLQVRAMGFFPITLPIDLQAGVPVRVPVSLRSRPTLAFEGTVQTGQAAAQDRPRTAQAAAPAPASAEPEAETDYPDLPHGFAPINIAVSAQPAVPISVDGRTTDGYDVRLHHLRGRLVIGTMELPYDILPGSALELHVPMDAAAWYKGDQQLKATSVIKFSHGSVRVRRVTPKGEQSALLRRLD